MNHTFLRISLLIFPLFMGCDIELPQPKEDVDPFANTKVVHTINGFNGIEAVETRDSALYIGDISGVSLYEITNPESPNFTLMIGLPNVQALLATYFDQWSDHLYVACGGLGLTIFEIADTSLLNPTSISYIPGGYYCDLLSIGANLHVPSQTSRGTRVFNLDTPTAPTLSYSIDDTANAIATCLTSGDGHGGAVSRVATANYNKNLKIWGTLSPDSQELLTSLSFSYNLLSLSSVTDEPVICVGGESNFSCVSPVGYTDSTPSIKSTLPIAGYVYDIETFVSLTSFKNYAFLAAGNAGLIIVDVENPNNPVIVKQITFSEAARSVKIYDDEYVFVGCDNSLQVIKI